MNKNTQVPFVMSTGRHLYFVKTVDNRYWYARGNVTQDAESVVQMTTGKNTVLSCTPIPE